MLDEKRKKEIMESTDSSMDEMGYVIMHHSGDGFGSTSKSIPMTKKEALLRGLYEGQGVYEPWKSYRRDKEEIQKEEEIRRIKEENLQKEIEEIFAENPELDLPKVYEVLVRNGNPYTPITHTSKEYRVLTERQVRAARLLRTLNVAYSDIEIIGESNFSNEIIEKEKEDVGKRIEKLYNSDNADLEKTGKSQKVSNIYRAYGIYGVDASITYRQAMLASPDFDESKIGFKTYEQIEQEKIEEERRKEEQPKSKITFSAIKTAIKKALGRGER